MKLAKSKEDLRPEERVAAVAFSKFLRVHRTPHNWEPGENPPDIVFFVGEEKWAVEVTLLYRELSLEGVSESEATIDYNMSRLADHIKEECHVKSQRIYYITFEGVYPFWKMEKDLVQRVQGYIDSGQTEEKNLDRPENFPAEIFGRGAVNIWSTEAQNDGSRIEIMWLAGATAPTADGKAYASNVSANVNVALGEIAKKKRKVFERLEGFDQRILLIGKEYLFAEHEIVSKSLESFKDTDLGWDAVFFFSSEDEIVSMYDPARRFRKSF